MQFITHILLQPDLPTVNLLDAQDVQKELVLVWMCASRLYVSVRLRLYFLLSSVDVFHAIRFSLSMMRVNLTRQTWGSRKIRSHSSKFGVFIYRPVNLESHVRGGCFQRGSQELALLSWIWDSTSVFISHPSQKKKKRLESVFFDRLFRVR